MQTKLQSLFESLTNIAVGYIVSILSQLVIFPLFGISTTIKDNLMIGLFFTVVSIVRGYCLRRFFNWYHCRKAWDNFPMCNDSEAIK